MDNFQLYSIKHFIMYKAASLLNYRLCDSIDNQKLSS